MACRGALARTAVWMTMAALLAGCLGLPQTSDAPVAADGGEVSYRTISAGLNSHYPERADLVITNTSEWGTFWGSHTPDVHVVSTTSPASRAPESPPPSVDFDRETVIAVMMGRQPSNCYGLYLSSVVQESGSSFRIEAVESGPSGDDRVCDSSETGPHQIIVVPVPHASASVVRVAGS